MNKGKNYFIKNILKFGLCNIAFMDILIPIVRKKNEEEIVKKYKNEKN